ncbi:MAG: calcium-translocating P-type ATPase, PMCA-type [Candidatus Pacearchaeota archaeon]
MGDAYSLDTGAILSSLGTDQKLGLSTEVATKRLAEHGLNEIKRESGVKALTVFFRQFKSFIIYILIFALVISIVVKEYTDAYAIGAILLLNAVFGFVQEYRAEKSIEKLQRLSSLKSKVIRGGEVLEIDSKNIVIGDIVLLEEGDKVPADGRVLESISLSVLESSLTGESNAQSKHTEKLSGMLVINDQKNMVFSGTLVTNGRGRFVVTATGMNTELGTIAHLLTDVKKEETPLQKKLDKFGKSVGYGVLAISLIIFVIGIVKENILAELLAGNYSEFLIDSRVWLLTAVALAVAAVPEGLPAVVTISLAIGVKRMLKKNSLIRRLPSVETLGETTVICCDKTGTLTKNEMTVRNIFVNNKDYSISGEGYSLNGAISVYGSKFAEKDSLILRIGALCNNSELHISGANNTITGDPTEAALLVSAAKAGLEYKKLREQYERVNEVPFDSTRKMMSTVHKDGKNFLVYTKGAPERVLAKCSRALINGRSVILNEKIRKEILAKNAQYADNALRVLAFAYKSISKNTDDVESHLTFVGLQAMIDPPKIEVKDYILRSKESGIRVVMITGDNIHTAVAIAKEIGLEGEGIEGMHFSQMGDLEKRKVVLSTNIFARVEPQHKLEIVRLLQESGAVVAMTGDGVNDSPALKRADIGISMGIKGTDVAQEASDMVLLDDNFSTIVSAVEEGRGIYKNILAFVNYLISSNIAEVLIVVLAIIFGMPLPLTALMLLWINLVTDGLPALALSVDPYPKGLMAKPPRAKNEPLFVKSTVFEVIYVAVLIAAGVLGIFTWGLQGKGLEVAHAQTLAFTTIVLLELTRAYVVRSSSGVPLFSNIWLMFAVVTSFLLQLLVVYGPLQKIFETVPLSITDWGMISVTVFVVLFLSILGLGIKRKID